MSEPVRVAMWSGPRNISTALMRSWENRPDTVVADEPLYAAYLARTGLDHPGRDTTIASQSTDPDQVVADLLAPFPEGISVRYAKHMSQHIADDMDLEWTLELRNVVLIRDPEEVVASYVRARETCEPADIGLLQQQRMLGFWDSRDAAPPVIDSRDFLLDPEGYLRWLCAWAGIGFTSRMLTWPPGPRDTDGAWAPFWYDAVTGSTGFEPWRPRVVDLSEHDAEVAAACRPAYEELHGRRLRL